MSALFYFFISFAQAGFLKMASTSSLHLAPEGSGLRITGTYTIDNQGDETARSVFPTFALDRLQWSGESRNLAAGEKTTWELDEKIEAEYLCLRVSEECPLALPLEGTYLIQVRKNYQDLNGYKFEIPDIAELPLKEQSRVPLGLVLKITTVDQKNFDAIYSFKNPFASPILFAVQIHLPKEVQQTTSSVPPVQVPSEGEIQGSFQFENVRGLIGSEYVAVLSAEWAFEGKRYGQWTYQPFRIQKKSSQKHWSLDQAFWAWWIWGVFFGFILMWIFWIRPLRRLPK